MNLVLLKTIPPKLSLLQVFNRAILLHHAKANRSASVRKSLHLCNHCLNHALVVRLGLSSRLPPIERNANKFAAREDDLAHLLVFSVGALGRHRTRHAEPQVFDVAEEDRVLLKRPSRHLSEPKRRLRHCISTCGVGAHVCPLLVVLKVGVEDRPLGNAEDCGHSIHALFECVRRQQSVIIVVIAEFIVSVR